MLRTAEIVAVINNNNVPYVRVPIPLRKGLGLWDSKYVIVSCLDDGSMLVESLEKGIKRVQKIADGQSVVDK